MIKLITIVGARPQFIKAAAISRKIKSCYKDTIEEILVHTGQHYDHGMSEIFFEEMNIPQPKYNLSIGSSSHSKQTGEMLKAIEEVLHKEKPDAILIYGDTNSTLAGALAASKIHVPVIHVEAGLRSFNKKMPEEINRIMTDHVSTLLFSPTTTGITNLKNEGLVHTKSKSYSMDSPGIFQCGDIMYDNSLYYSETAKSNSSIFTKNGIDPENFVLSTIHRPSNTDSEENLENILRSLLKIAKDLNTSIVLPLHPRTAASLKNLNKQALVKELIPEKNIHLIPAVSFLEMVELESNTRLIITDSGGVQKEAWFMKKPVVILRKESEWVEIIEHGNGILAGANPEAIFSAAKEYLTNPPTDFPRIYGNGDAAGEILKIVASTEWR